MRDLTTTSLSRDERALLERFVEMLRERLGDELHAVWLFGSRARGEPPSHEDSDVDLLVLVEDDSWDASTAIYRVLDEAAGGLGLRQVSFWFALHVHTPEWLEGRRAVKDFFIAEVDRDTVPVDGPA